MHLTTISTRSLAQPQSGELLHHFFPPPWWHEVHIFPTLTPVAQVAITVCIFPRKRAPVARFTALNNLDLERNSQRVLRIPPPPSPRLLWGRFLQGGDGLSQVVWRTDLEVDLTRTQNYCVELLALYLLRTIIEIQYLDEVVSQRGSCRNNALPQSPQEKL